MKQRKPMGKIRALILSLLDPQLYAAVDGQAPPVEGARAVSNGSVLSLSAAWACTRLIAETISTLPLSIYENGRAGKRVATEHPLHFIVHDQPNPDSTAAVFWESMVASMLLRGNAYAEKLLLDGRLVGLQFLHPDCMTVRIGKNGGREVQFRGPDGRVRDIPMARVWHLPGFSLDGRNGVSILKHGASMFGTAMAVQDAARSTFQRGLHQTTALKMPGTLKADQRDEAREALGKLSGAINAGRSIVLEGGTDVVTVGIKPVDAQMIEAQGFSVEEICRWFRVPPFMVGHAAQGQTNWGTGIESQLLGFLSFTLAPWLKRIEQGIGKDLLEPGGRYYAKHAVEGLLRADSQARAAFYSAMVNNGIMTRDECRTLEDREPMGGNAAVLTVQTALAPLDTLGQSTDSEQARAALRAWLGDSAQIAQN